MWQKNAIVGQKTHLFLLKFACFRDLYYICTQIIMFN